MQITVNHVVDSDDWSSSYGPMKGWYFMATDANGNEGLFQVNTKPTHALTAGTTFDFQPSGQTVERGGYTYQKGKRANQPQGGNRPQQQAFPATASPRSGGRPEADVIADFKRVNAALGGAASDGQATTIVLGILRGDIIPTPQQPQPQRLPMPAAKPMPQGYAPQEQQPEQDIPF